MQIVGPLSRRDSWLRLFFPRPLIDPMQIKGRDAFLLIRILLFIVLINGRAEITGYIGMQIPLLTDILIIFAMATGVYRIHHLKIPTIVGFLLTGVLAGPHGWASSACA